MPSINHSGTLDQRYNWAVKKDLNSGKWLPCNHEVVLTVPQHKQQNFIYPFLQETLSIANFV